MAIKYISYTKGSVTYVGNTNCSVNMTLNGSILPVVDEVEDLDVIVDSGLSSGTQAKIYQHVSFAIFHSHLITYLWNVPT